LPIKPARDLIAVSAAAIAFHPSMYAICKDNPVRVIDVFVDELDLAELGFNEVDPEATDRPSYHPSVLLKLYIYGYLNRVQSSRRLGGAMPPPLPWPIQQTCPMGIARNPDKHWPGMWPN
jgi:hypothetical protein